MDIKHESMYCFTASGADLEKIHRDLSNILRLLPKPIYEDLLICIHELIINSIVEMETTNHKDDLISIDLCLTDEKAILCLKDLGRGISKSKSKKDEEDPLKEDGRGLEIVMMLSDWFCIYPEDNCYAYYVIKNIHM
ncbi:MAG: ATP-binding protein [Tissierellia bacterium]|nr:ATP-binding protein [Tissierellia bacterium]